MDTELGPGALIAGKYELETELGRGGMGIVYSARHVDLGSKLAVKIMRHDGDADEQRVRRFLREARTVAGIKSDHVVRAFDVGVLPSGHPFMAMEQLDGCDGARWLSQRGRIPLPEVVGCLLQVVDALAEAHALGIVHRDLKLSNLFFTKRRDGSSSVKILDFGVSKVLGDLAPDGATDSTGASAMLGTPHYMSPEQLRAASDVDARTDIWSLGVICYRLVTGEYPFRGGSLPELCASIIAGKPRDVRELLPEAPASLSRVLARCLAKKLAQRYADVHELARDLATLVPGLPRGSLPRVKGGAASTLPGGEPSVQDEVGHTLDTLTHDSLVGAVAARSLWRPGWSLALTVSAPVLAALLLAAVTRVYQPRGSSRGDVAASATAVAKAPLTLATTPAALQRELAAPLVAIRDPATAANTAPHVGAPARAKATERATRAVTPRATAAPRADDDEILDETRR